MPQPHAAAAPRLGTMAATYARAVAAAVSPLATVVVVDRADGELWRAAFGSYRPRTVLRRFDAGAADVATLPEPMRAMVTGDAPRAYFCEGLTCAAPVSTAAELRTLLAPVRSS